MFGLGGYEVLIFVVILVLLFGSARLPKMARDFGSALTEMRKGFRDGVDSE